MKVDMTGLRSAKLSISTTGRPSAKLGRTVARKTDLLLHVRLREPAANANAVAKAEPLIVSSTRWAQGSVANQMQVKRDAFARSFWPRAKGSYVPFARRGAHTQKSRQAGRQRSRLGGVGASRPQCTTRILFQSRGRSIASTGFAQRN